MISFIYQPRSGDRVFVQTPSPWMAIVRWGNGCRHVAGNFVMLTWWAASQGKHWRADAVRALKEIIPQVGGIAWDAQGSVSACVPTHQARFVLDIMGRLSPDDHDDRKRNLAELWKAGAAHIRLTDRGMDIEPSFVLAPGEVTQITQPKAYCQGEILVHVGSENPLVIKSPWNIREVATLAVIVEISEEVEAVAEDGGAQY